MAQQQQTVLRVQTNIEDFAVTIPTGTMTIASGTTMTFVGSGTTANPYTGTSVPPNEVAYFNINNNGGTVYYMMASEAYTPPTGWTGPQYLYLIRNGKQYLVKRTHIQNTSVFGEFQVLPNDQIYLDFNYGTLYYLYFVPDSDTSKVYQNLDLDLYTDIPIKINKSFAELQDISKRNSDFSIGLSLPGSKKNNNFFESFFNVDVDLLYFNPLARVPSKVLINDEIYFDGYLRLNKMNVQNSKVEYDVTLFSNIGDLFGKIGNNLLKDLPYDEPTLLFNHFFDTTSILSSWNDVGFNYSGNPQTYLYPITHNGYNYTGDTVFLSGSTNIQNQTRLYTTSSPIDSYPTLNAMYTAGVIPYRSNTPNTGLLDNQLKPALNVYSLIQLMFQTYGYTIKSDFMNTPWMKGLYMYGYFNSDTTKFSYTTNPTKYSGNTQAVKVVETYVDTTSIVCSPQITTTRTYTITVVNATTGVPETASKPYSLCFDFAYFPCSGGTYPYSVNLNLPVGSTGTTYSWISNQFVPCPSVCTLEYRQNYGLNPSNSNIYEYRVGNAPITVTVRDGSYIDFNLIINDQLKQIDFLSSIAKKFNLIFSPDPDVPNQIIIEPYQYYVGTGQIFDWTNKLSFDKGFSVEPASNYIESEIILTDQDDGDDGNKQFKDRNNRIYGQNFVFNETQFKSQTKKIDTIFSPQVMRKWDDNVSVPLGINYVSANSPESSGSSEKVKWTYKGVKTKPKLFYYLGNNNAFLNEISEVYNSTYLYSTYIFYLMNSDGFGNSLTINVPVISNTMPLGNPDGNKINNDSICILFNSEQPTDIGVDIFDGINAYTDKDMYNLFYENRINNLYDPNTRFLNGYFNLNISDIRNVHPNDIIKINEQYFTWNKIDGFNMTNPELTKVELIQVDINPSKYVDRYFQYYYCADTGTTYNIKTDFTNSEMNLTHFYVSNFYDYNVGLLGGNVSGFTSSFKISFGEYLPFTIYEIDKNTYETTGVLYTNDPNRDWDDINSTDYVTKTYWETTGYTGTNLFVNCSGFTSTASSYGIVVRTPTGGTPTSIYTSGATINVTDTGWIKYDTPTGTVYKQLTSIGSTVLTDCLDCTTIRAGIPLADLASWTVINCGNTC